MVRLKQGVQVGLLLLVGHLLFISLTELCEWVCNRALHLRSLVLMFSLLFTRLAPVSDVTIGDIGRTLDAKVDPLGSINERFSAD